jgi:hypothetical protein
MGVNMWAIDFEFNSQTDDDVAAIAGGRIVDGTTTPIDNRGNFLEIDHDPTSNPTLSGHNSRYLHLAAGSPWAAGIDINVDVRQGQHIGYSGSTGTGFPPQPHLHLDLRLNDASGDPTEPIPMEPMSAQSNFGRWGGCGTEADKNSPYWYPDGDGDGYTEGEETSIGTLIADRCDPNSATTLPNVAWPSDLRGGSFTAGKVNLIDAISFTNPVRRYLTSPGDPNYSPRWDLVPGSGGLEYWINIADLGAMAAGYKAYPPMFGGTTRAFNGPTCTD